LTDLLQIFIAFVTSAYYLYRDFFIYKFMYRISILQLVFLIRFRLSDWSPPILHFRWPISW